MKAPQPFLIHGEARTSDDVAQVTHPFDGRPVATYCRPTAGDVEEAIRSSAQAFETTRRLPAYRRAEILSRAAQIVTDRRETLARTLALEAGKPIRHALAEVDRAANTLALSATEALRLGGELIPMDLSANGEGRTALNRRFPLGPVAGITPFNFPLNLVCHKVGPALAAGNAITVKPASATPLSALSLGKILLEAGAPAGAFNVIPAPAALADRLVTDPRFRMVTFTGSAPVGWAMKARAGKKRVCLELGGNAAVVIEPDADLDRAVSRCAVGGFAYAGQVCISVQRVLVHRSLFDDFIRRFTRRVQALTVGDPLDPATDVGSLIDEANARRIESWIAEAVDGGAKLLIGGQRQGTVVMPAVLTGTRSEDKVWRQEAFGPLVVVEPYQDFDVALASVNDSDFGLQAGVFTKDLEKAFRAFEQVEAGGVIINDVPTFRMDHMPYGGVKDSGFGREGVRYAVEEMTESKLLVIGHG